MKWSQYLLTVLITISYSNKSSDNHQVLKRSDFSFVSLKGNHIPDSSMKDKKLILNIWATWCKPCIDEMPSLEKLSRKLPNDYIVLLASNEEKGKIRRFQERYPFDLEFVRLKEDPQNLGIDLFPTTFIFDKKGEVVEIHKGVRDWNMMELP